MPVNLNNSAAPQVHDNASATKTGEKLGADERQQNRSAVSKAPEPAAVDSKVESDLTSASRWLDWQCRMLSGVLAGGVFLFERGDGSTLRSVACWPTDTPQMEHLRKVAAEGIQGRSGVIQKREDKGVTGAALSDDVAYPIVVRDRVVGTVALSLTLRSEPQQKALLQLLQWGIMWLEGVLAEQPTRLSQLRRVLMDRVAQSLESKPLSLLANDICNLIADQCECKRAALGVVKGLRVRVLALSHQLRFDQRATAVMELEAAMEECSDQGKPIVVSDDVRDATALTRVHDELSRRQGQAALCSVPLRSGDQVVGVMTLAGSAADSFTEDAVTAIQETAALLGPILGLKIRDQEPLARRAMRSARAQAAKLFGTGAIGYKLAMASALTVIALLGVIKADQRVSARSMLEGSLQRAIVAPYAGYLATALARAGDVVDEGKVLATLDDRDLLIEQERWSSERAKHAQERQAALAVRDRARVGVLAARIAQADAELHLIEEKLKRTQLRAPFSGVVVSGDLSRSLGTPVDRGQVLFELAPLEGYRAVLQVDEHDMADLSTGQAGSLRLAGFPDAVYALTIDRIVPLAAADAGGNYFRVEAALIDASSELRPGMRGVAKIVVGRSSLLWIWTRELWGRLRLWAWSLGF